MENYGKLWLLLMSYSWLLINIHIIFIRYYCTCYFSASCTINFYLIHWHLCMCCLLTKNICHRSKVSCNVLYKCMVEYISCKYVIRYFHNTCKTMNDYDHYMASIKHATKMLLFRLQSFEIIFAWFRAILSSIHQIFL